MNRSFRNFAFFFLQICEQSFFAKESVREDQVRKIVNKLYLAREQIDKQPMHGGGIPSADNGAESHDAGENPKHFKVYMRLLDDKNEVYFQEEAEEVDGVQSGVSNVLRNKCEVVPTKRKQQDYKASNKSAKSLADASPADAFVVQKPAVLSQDDPFAHRLANTGITLYPESEDEWKQIKALFGKVSKLDQVVLHIFTAQAKNNVLEYSRRLQEEDAHKLQGKERAGMFGVLSQQSTDDSKLIYCVQCMTNITKHKSPHHFVVTWRGCELQDGRTLMKPHKSDFCSRQCFLFRKQQSHGTIRYDLFDQNARWNRRNGSGSGSGSGST